MWIIELLKFLFSFIPSIKIIEPDTRQVICFMYWTWVRSPGIRIVWPFWLAEQMNVNVSHFCMVGSYIEGGVKSGWEATAVVSDPMKYVYSTQCEEENDLLISVINRKMSSGEDVSLVEYGVEIVDIQETTSGVMVMSFNGE